jgi:ferredoxin-NADP reductase
VGSTVKIKGPTGQILYAGRGLFNVDGQTIRARRVSLIAGGTGITPIVRIAVVTNLSTLRSA